MALSCVRPMTVPHLGLVGIFTMPKNPVNVTNPGKAVPKILAAAAAPVNKKQPLTVEEKRSQIREWGGQGRIQKITGVICDPPVSSQHSPSSSRGGPRNYVKEVDVVPSTFSSSVKQGGSPAITANANDLLSSSPASSFQPAKRTPTNLPDAAQVQSYYKQKFDLVAEVDDEEYHIISPQEAGDAAAWDDRQKFWKSWRRDLRDVFQYISEYEVGEVDQKHHLFAIQEPQETLFATAFQRHGANKST